MGRLFLLHSVLTGALATPSALLADHSPTQAAAEENNSHRGSVEDDGRHPPLLPSQDDPDTEVNRAEPDFTVVNLPTTLRLPRHKAAFRITHRFARPLGSGDLGDLAADLFGLDGGAQIGLELRFGLFSGTQVGLYRTSDRTIEVFLQQDVIRQGRSPFGLAALEGLDNLQEEYTPLVGLVLSRKLGQRAAPLRGADHGNLGHCRRGLTSRGGGQRQPRRAKHRGPRDLRDREPCGRARLPDQRLKRSENHPCPGRSRTSRTRRLVPLGIQHLKEVLLTGHSRSVNLLVRQR